MNHIHLLLNVCVLVTPLRTRSVVNQARSLALLHPGVNALVQRRDGLVGGEELACLNHVVPALSRVVGIGRCGLLHEAVVLR